MHDWLSTSEESPYRQNLVVQRWSEDSHATLRGKVLTLLTPSGKDKQTLPSREAWLTVLRQQFDIELSPDDAARLWQNVEHRHSTIAAGKAAADLHQPG
jgi:arylamine N-acetyltransferase